MSQLSGKKVIGLTGTMGSGKSTARRLLEQWVPCEDCDQITARLLAKEGRGYAALRNAGLLITDEQNNLDRPATAARLFSDSVYKKAYESLIQKMILEEMQEWISKQRGICVVEVPLLFELGLQKDFDEIWTITCDQPTALERLQNGRNISRTQALARLACQMNNAQKAKGSTRVFWNEGTPEDLEALLQKALLDCVQSSDFKEYR